MWWWPKEALLLLLLYSISTCCHKKSIRLPKGQNSKKGEGDDFPLPSIALSLWLLFEGAAAFAAASSGPRSTPLQFEVNREHLLATTFVDVVVMAACFACCRVSHYFAGMYDAGRK